MRKQLCLALTALLCLSLVFGWHSKMALAAAGDLTLVTAKTVVDGNERFIVQVSIVPTPNLYGVQFSLTYNDQKLNVIGLNVGSLWPVGSTFLVRQSNSGGGSATESIEFAATLTDASKSMAAGGELLTIIFEAVNPIGADSTVIGAGTSLPLILSNQSGTSLTPAQFSNSLTISINPSPQVTGIVTLQSPGAARLITVVGSNLSGQDSRQITSGNSFALNLPTTIGSVGQYELTAVAPCHLTARKASVTSPSTGHTKILIAGDVNGDNLINIQDLAAMGNLFGQAPGSLLCADLDESGIVNILDLSRAASNYGQQGPLTW